MDLILRPLDEYVLTPYVYPEYFKEDQIERQVVTLFFVASIGSFVLYFLSAGFAYIFLFDKEIRNHQFFLKDQEKVEIKYALIAIPWMAVYSTPFFVAEVRGYAKLYDTIDEKGWDYWLLSLFLFFAWNDFAVYWVHRALHHPLLYKRVHKVHHLFKVHTPFAALAFTPMDGFSQSLPKILTRRSYHIFIFCVPFHKVTFLASFVGIQLWTVFIHDHFYMIPESWDYYVNGSKHHTDHHMYFEYNYGLYFTLWDRIGGTHRVPSVNQGNGPLDQIHEQQQKAKGETVTEKKKV